MSLRFVKSSILSSEDGIDFSKETIIESEEAKIARIQAERASHKSLYEQLEEQNAKKQAEYDAVTKQIFAAPKAIDDEEYGFLQTLEDDRIRKEEEKRAKQEEALESFRNSIKESKSSDKPKLTVPSLKPQTTANPPAPVVAMPIVKVKRKVVDISSGELEKQQAANKLQKIEPSTNEKKDDSQKAEKASITSLLGDYGSDDEDENS